MDSCCSPKPASTDTYRFHFPEKPIGREQEPDVDPGFLCDYLLDMKISLSVKDHPLDIAARR